VRLRTGGILSSTGSVFGNESSALFCTVVIFPTALPANAGDAVECVAATIHSPVPFPGSRLY
jgi:hypothetical protein